MRAPRFRVRQTVVPLPARVSLLRGIVILTEWSRPPSHRLHEGLYHDWPASHFHALWCAQRRMQSLTKTAEVYTNNSHSGHTECNRAESRHSSVVTCTQVLSILTVAHSFALAKTQTVSFQSFPHSLRKQKHPGWGYGAASPARSDLVGGVHENRPSGRRFPFALC